MKRIILITLALGLGLSAIAQEAAKKSVPEQTMKVGGFVMTQASYTSNATPSSTLNLRLARLQVTGKILGDFDYRLQLQVSGTSGSISGPRIVDAYVEWQKYTPFYVKFGQFKRAFTFENPMHPIEQGFYGYSQPTSYLAGMNDRVKEHASNGRDLGLQFQGDLFELDNHPLLHYQIGVYNGQGINVKDVDNNKDLIGGLWFIPVPGMRIGAFGWYGTYSRNGYLYAANTTQKSIVTLPRRRYAISGEYKVNDWTFRSEYIHSYGPAFAYAYGSNYTDIDNTLGYYSDAAYALVIAPIIADKFHAKARYDVYRDNKTWDRACAHYDVGLDYWFTKNLILSGIYSFVSDKRLANPNYSLFDFQLSFRF